MLVSITKICFLNQFCSIIKFFTVIYVSARMNIPAKTIVDGSKYRLKWVFML